MSDKIILHCDLNNFFASVSLLSNPTLYNTPVAVCGSLEERHGIVLSKNEPAKKYGVKTAETIWEAKSKCPNLVILPPDYNKYREYSNATREIFTRYTDLVEPFGIDEAWLDVTGSTFLFGSGKSIADKIRNDVKKELGLTVSVGVSFNKIFAKLGSDMKKPDAVTEITRENFKEKVWPLPVSDLLFVGSSTAKKLNEYGINTIGDLTECSDQTVKHLLGKNGESLKLYALGKDNSPVNPPDENDRPKSIGKTVTPPKDICCDEEVWKLFINIAEDITKQLRRYGLYACGIQIYTRSTALKVKEFSRRLKEPANTTLSLAQNSMRLFKESFNWDYPLRSVGFRAIYLHDSSCAVQQNIFSDSENSESQEKIEKSIEEVRKRFGDSSIVRGRTL